MNSLEDPKNVLNVVIKNSVHRMRIVTSLLLRLCDVMLLP